MNEQTIQLKDAVTNENAVIIIRLESGNIRVCLSLEKNGDAEVFLRPSEIRQFISALQEMERLAH